MTAQRAGLARRTVSGQPGAAHHVSAGRTIADDDAEQQVERERQTADTRATGGNAASMNTGPAGIAPGIVGRLQHEWGHGNSLKGKVTLG